MGEIKNRDTRAEYKKYSHGFGGPGAAGAATPSLAEACPPCPNNFYERDYKLER